MGVLYLSGYLFSVAQVEAWANHHDLKIGPSEAGTLDRVENHGYKQGFPSHFQWVYPPDGNGNEVPHALLISGFRETPRRAPPDFDLLRLVPENTPLARRIRDSWITPLLATVPLLRSVSYTVVEFPRLEPCPQFVAVMKEMYRRDVIRRSREAVTAASAQTVAAPVLVGPSPSV